MRLAGGTEETDHRREIAFRDIDLLALVHRERVALVLQHHDRLQLHLVGRLHEIGVADDLLRLGRVEIGILEKPRAENVEQQTDGGCLETLAHRGLAQLLDTHLIGLQDRTLIVVATKLVDARHQDAVMTLGDRHLLGAPGLAGEGLDARLIARDAPIGTDHALVAHLLAKLVGDQVAVVAVGDVVAIGRLADGDGIIGHDGRGHAGRSVKLEGALREGYFLLLDVLARIDGIFAITVVRVAARLARSAARPVLDHGVDTLVAPAILDFLVAFRGLETVDVSACHIGRQIWILTKGAAHTAPARLRRHIYLRREGGGDAQRTILF